MGRVKRPKPTEKLILLLEREGFSVDHIVVSRGYWSHAHQDVCRWDTNGDRLHTGESCYLRSWDTVTKCIRNGIRIVPIEDVDGWFEVWSK